MPLPPGMRQYDGADMSARFRRLLRAALAALALGLPAFCAAAHAAAAGIATASDVDQRDLSDSMAWCESAPSVTVEAIADGHCAFVATTPALLERGYATQAQWLKLTIDNPEDRPIERWLQIGDSRLQSVVFFERDGSAWRRTESGIAVPARLRPAATLNPVLPIAFGPRQSRSLLIRVESRTPINLTATLWRPQAYVFMQGRSGFLLAAALGCLMTAALFSLMIALAGRMSQWSNETNLYFSGWLAAKVILNASTTGVLATWLLPESSSFDIPIQGVAATAAAILFLMFLRRFTESRRSAPGFDRLFRLMIAALLLQGGVGTLSGTRVPFFGVIVTMCAAMVAATILLWRKWRGGMAGSGYLLVACTVDSLAMFHRIVIAVSGGYHSNALALAYSWVDLLTVPLAPISIAIHEASTQRELDAARRDSAARVAFLAQMSHELRTPLDTILGNAQLLARPNSQAALSEGLEAIQLSGWHLLHMIDDILDHARGLSGALRLAPVSIDFPAFLRAVTRDAERIAARKGNVFALRLSGPPLRRVRLDPGRLRQILDNLIANAGRHTTRGRIDLDCVVTPKDSARVTLGFTVTDDGEGVAIDDLERIFLPFERGKGTLSRYGGKGLGMGLAISRQLAELMGGRLTVDSRPGKGASFRFHVLAERDKAVEPADAPSEAAVAGPRRRILLVDDEDANRQTLATFLRIAGFEVIEAQSGRAALAAWPDDAPATNRPDLALTDQFMADGDGWMVLEALARRDRAIPVIAISSAPPERPADFPPDLHFAAHLMKPLDHGKLLLCIGDLIGLERPPERAPTPAPDEPHDGRTVPPASMTAALTQMIAEGRVSDIMDWAHALEASDPDQADWAKAIRAAVERLDFTALERLATPQASGVL